MAEPYYTTVVDLRTKLGVDSSTLPDSEALDLIEDAEDVVDGMLGGRVVDAASGRKVVQAAVLASQFRKITRATLAIAALHYANPALGDSQQFDKQRGPDFELWGPKGSIYGARIRNMIVSSGLAVLTTRASGGGVPRWPGTRVPRTNADSDPW